jgi:hypothetical protein
MQIFERGIHCEACVGRLAIFLSCLHISCIMVASETPFLGVGTADSFCYRIVRFKMYSSLYIYNSVEFEQNIQLGSRIYSKPRSRNQKLYARNHFSSRII